MFDSNCCFLNCIQVSQEAGEVVWYSHLFKNFLQFVVIHTVQKHMFSWNSLDFSVIQRMLAYWFLVSLPFLNPACTSVHVLSKPSLEDFKHYITNMWNESNCVVVWHSSALPFFGTGTKTDLFQSCNHCWVFQVYWHIECSTLTASSFRIWNTSAEIPSPPLVCSE